MSIQQNYGNIKPSLNLDFANTKQLDPRITYSRASTGTYYDGKTVAKAEENLFVRSQEFDLVWAKVNVSITANSTVAPDGTTTADTLTTTAPTLDALVTSVATSAAAYTFSVYLKQGNTDFSEIGIVDQGLVVNRVRLTYSTGALTVVAGTPTGTATNAGNGWWRVSITYTFPASGTDAFNIFPGASGVGSGEFAYIWGAQLEQRSFATAYTPTTTAPITNYIPVLQTASAGTPRFDHNPITGESLGLLIEEQRTNLLLRSEEFDNAAWTKISTTITANTIVAPDGTLTGDKLASSTVSVASHQDYQIGITITNAATYTWSVYMKQGEYAWGIVNAYSATDSRTYFNLATGTVGTVAAGSTATITPVGNGWYRCSVTRTSAASTGGLSIEMTNADNVPSFAAIVGNGIYIWGAQLEAGAFATSYIPTVASQVTRAADSASMTGTNFSSWYNQSEGTLYAEYATTNTGTPRVWTISDNTTSNQAWVQTNLTAFTVFSVYTAGIYVAQIGSAASSSKAAATLKTNDFAVVNAGGTIYVDTSGAIANYTKFSIGSRFDDVNGSQLNGTIKKLAYYPRRITNTQLQALTS